MDGWIKLYREIVNKDIYVQPPLYLKVFERLVMEANRSCKRIPYNKGTKLIKRGERLTSIRQIAEWVGWYERGIFKIPNPKTISDILVWLAKKEMVEIYNKNSCYVNYESNSQVTVKNGKRQNKSNTQETHYNIVNYCIYQSKEGDESNNQVTVKFPAKINEGIQQLDTNKKGKNIRSKEVRILYSSEHIRMAEKLKSLILINNPGAKTPDDLSKWAIDFDRINRIDKRTEQQINAVIEFSQKDSFWKSNILSAGKLREQFDTLWLQKDRPKQGRPPQADNFEQRKYTDEEFDKLYNDV